MAVFLAKAVAMVLFDLYNDSVALFLPYGMVCKMLEAVCRLFWSCS